MKCELFLHLLAKHGREFEAADFQAHRRSCSSCQEKVLETIFLQKIQQHYAQVVPPAYLEGKIKANLAKVRPAQPFLATFLKSLLVVTCGFLLLAVSFRVFQNQQEVGVAMITPYLGHVRHHSKMRTRHDRKVRSYAEVEAFLTAYPLHKVPRLPEAAQLEGVSLCEIGNRKVIHLFYRYQDKPLHLLLFPEKLRKEGVLYEGKSGEASAVALSMGRAVCLLVGPFPVHLLKSLSQTIRYQS